jgi:hypothetical protein
MVSSAALFKGATAVRIDRIPKNDDRVALFLAQNKTLKIL